jgi:hypothetical protein
VLFRRYSSHPRRSRRMQTFGAEGADRSEVPHVRYAPVQGGRQIRWDASNAQCDRGGVVDWFGAEGAARTVALALLEGRRDTWPRRTCKGAPYELETRGAVWKGGSARMKTRWRPVRGRELLLYPCKACKAVCQGRKRCNWGI